MIHRLLTLFCALFLASNARSQGSWPVFPDFKGGFEDISGAACGPQRCIAVNDETHFAQQFRIEQDRLIPDQKIDLLADEAEIDAEAIAYDGGAFYIAGSHGLSRKSSKFRPSQFLVFRVEGKSIARTDRLRDAIRNAPMLRAYAERPLNKNGANIEGMAAVDRRLYFGFRGPSVRDQAFVLETPESALFGDGLLPSRTHLLPLGPRIGIRDMARVSEGILILTGPVNTLPRRYTLALWTPECGVTRPLAELPPAPDGKPEGVLVLSETASDYELLIFYDGAPNGAPTRFTVGKAEGAGD